MNKLQQILQAIRNAATYQPKNKGARTLYNLGKFALGAALISGSTAGIHVIGGEQVISLHDVWTATKGAFVVALIAALERSLADPATLSAVAEVAGELEQANATPQPAPPPTHS